MAKKTSITSGPLLNNVYNARLTRRDPLGVESWASSVTASICPIINTNTSRPFYWMFYVWILHDYCENTSLKERSEQSFKQFLKRQDYFFVLANLLVDGSDRSSLVGIRSTERDKNNNKTGEYSFNSNYVKAANGGMQYYSPGCEAMHFLSSSDEINHRKYSFPKEHPVGREMALAFEKAVSNTRYYKEYRWSDIPIPEDVLIEYGKVLNLSLDNLESCKAILKKVMFERQEFQKIKECSDYIHFLQYKERVTDFGSKNLRRVLYDSYSPRGAQMRFPKEITNTVKEWEILVGRHYFTIAIEIIFSHVLDVLSENLISMSEWLNRSIKRTEFSFDISNPLSTIIEKCKYDYDTREKMIRRAEKQADERLSIACCILVDVYNRFVDRDDLGKGELYLGGRGPSVKALIDMVKTSQNQSIQSFLMWIIREWVVRQHEITAFEKMLQNRDGYFFEVIDGHYRGKQQYFPEFQGIRLTQLSQVMKDLDML